VKRLTTAVPIAPCLSATGRNSPVASARSLQRRAVIAILAAWVAIAGVIVRASSDETALFDGEGKPIAYVALDEDSTIYLWSGKPVAYLSENSNGGFDVYGFNGRHLGWFVSGIIWAHDGKVGCATSARMRTPAFEPFKGFKEFKPFKNFKEFAPYRPTFVMNWSETACNLLLGRGSE
jgi:hypothetical protein